MKIKLLFIIALAYLLPSLVSAQWTPRLNVSPNAVATSLNENAGPCLAVKGDTIHIVWCDRRPSGASIWYKSSFDAGLTWNPEKPITDTTGSASFPVIAVSGLTLHAVWMDTSLGHNASFYKRSLDNGITWSP